MAEFLMPSLGADMEAGTLVKWRREVGARVKRGDIIAEVETEKGLVEVESFASGVIERFVVQPGTKVPVGTVLAIIRQDGEPSGLTEEPGKGPATSVRASPLARRRARELGVDLGAVVPSAADGAVTVGDVERAAAAKGAKAEAAPTELSPERRMRRAIAATLSRAKREIPHFYLRQTVDLAPALAWLSAHNASRAPAERVLLGALLVRAVARAARAVPEVNAQMAEDGEAKPLDRVHVGVAVSLRNGGLVAPAIHDADRMGTDELMRALLDVTTRARAGTLKSSEMSDATITLTSLGERGVQEVVPVILPPQVAMVGAGAVRTRPWVVTGEANGDTVVARPLVDLTLAVDHRVTDGHRASRFLLEMEKVLAVNPEEP